MGSLGLPSKRWSFAGVQDMVLGSNTSVSERGLFLPVLPGALALHHTHTALKNLSRFQSCLNSFLGQESCKLPTGNGMIFHSDLAAARFKQKPRRRAKEVISFLPQGSSGLSGTTGKTVKTEILYEKYSISF